MSEKIYAWLLRLYPPQFREEFGEEALQLFRDRNDGERGFAAQVRLWLDLIADVAISLPSQHRYARKAAIADAGAHAADGTPSFHALEELWPRPEALAVGTVLTVAVAITCVSLGVVENQGTFHAHNVHAGYLSDAPLTMMTATGLRFRDDHLNQLPFRGLLVLAASEYPRASQQENCPFETVKVLPHNIGYVKLDSVPARSLCESQVMVAMASLRPADAIILDLREGSDGSANVNGLLVRFGDKPVYVLTSKRTFAGAAQALYDLRRLKRATVVGELAPSAAGLEADVRVKASEALETAEKLAANRLATR